ncbi:MAG: S-layer homology domain-containing protein, partial [Desulfotomaculales bacterium]
QAYSYWIEAAARRGLVTGYPPADPSEPKPVFKMWRQIHRQEAVAIVARAAGLKISDDPKAVEDGLKKAFQDYDKIAAWARPYVLAAYQAKLITGVPVPGQVGAKTQYEFKPTDFLTRAQAAKLVYFMAKKNKKL